MNGEKNVEPKLGRTYVDFCFWKKKSPAEVEPLDPAKLVPVNQLPLYSEDYPKPYVFVRSSPLPMQESISKVRHSATEQYGTLKDRFKDADRLLHKSVQAAYVLNQQIREEWTTVPKGMAILMGGMAGYILGMRRCFIRRWFYSITGLATMAAFCYPDEAAHIFRTGIAHSKMAWSNFKESPEPPVDAGIVSLTESENLMIPSEGSTEGLNEGENN